MDRFLAILDDEVLGRVLSFLDEPWAFWAGWVCRRWRRLVVSDMRRVMRIGRTGCDERRYPLSFALACREGWINLLDSRRGSPIVLRLDLEIGGPSKARSPRSNPHLAASLEAFRLAAKRGHREVVEFLLPTLDVSLSRECYREWTCYLGQATPNSQHELVAYLRRGRHVGGMATLVKMLRLDVFDLSPLVCKAGSKELVEEFLAGQFPTSGIAEEYLGRRKFPKPAPGDDWSPRSLFGWECGAARAGNLAPMRAALTERVVESEVHAIFLRAVTAGALEIVREILESTDETISRGAASIRDAALQRAIRRNRCAIARCLFEHGAMFRARWPDYQIDNSWVVEDLVPLFDLICEYLPRACPLNYDVGNDFVAKLARATANRRLIERYPKGSTEKFPGTKTSGAIENLAPGPRDR